MEIFYSIICFIAKLINLGQYVDLPESDSKKSDESTSCSKEKNNSPKAKTENGTKPMAATIAPKSSK